MDTSPENQPLSRVLIVGAGFGGLQAARDLKHPSIQVTLIDKNNYHLFQPLLYQVATAGLSAPDIAAPIRSLLRKRKNVEVLMAEVQGIDLAAKRVRLQDREIPYDYLILAPGARYNYFGHEAWEREAPGLKSIEDALLIRKKILTAFERAEMENDAGRRQALLNFVIVGAGPTGVELAGSIAELAHKALASDFRHMKPSSARILLVEAGPKILGGFREDLSAKALKKLESLGVDVLLQSSVEEVSARGVRIKGEWIPSATVLWAAGVKASPLIQQLGCETDRQGRAVVSPELSLPGHPEVFVIGDAASVLQDGKPLAGMAPQAKQEGAYVARWIQDRLEGKQVEPFRYFDKGQMATVGRLFAIVQMGKRGMAGALAWFAWLVVHIFYLIGFENKMLVFVQWAWAYFTFHRGARVIFDEEKAADSGA